ncbi:fructose-bisphosphatase class III [Labilibaculum sp. A4]|uniref:fructose-1,6-bisphosphatase n=1 Tax=Labilibaculum euxinus TaxID=2686357 RepID=UPI000F61D656|nr:fructose-1,6-bisphosphatase [Labilibaculum euxinus]MDQ1770213.1 fructose-1,6-bisphosphatase [Labilibaculum euxinus]MWN77573.1 fructose-bisphosphatase class III [Labilibaculum euxinus]
MVPNYNKDQLLKHNYSEDELRFLNLLAEKFPTVQAACTEIINLESIMNLPKGTEHFLTDIHGEYETFSHVLRNASGMVRKKIDIVYGNTISEKEKNQLSTLIYYPEDKLKLITKEQDNLNEWFAVTLRRLIDVARVSADKYTQSKVRKAMPADFAYVIDELLNEPNAKKEKYFECIIQSIIDVDRANQFIVAISKFIQRLLIDRLHIIGDIYDRGPYADKVMDVIQDHYSVDIQWGNHDIVWMAAATGIRASIAAVIRLSARYNNLDTLEDAYGINLMPLATFAMKAYEGDPCEAFIPKNTPVENIGSTQIKLTSKMHKAIMVIEMKLAGEIIQRNPEMEMGDRLLLDKIDYEKGTVIIDGRELVLNDKSFPTIDPKNPYQLTEEEKELAEKLQISFLYCDKLQRHIKTLFSKGGTYLSYNSNLLFHGCIPLDEKGDFKELTLLGEKYKGKALCDQFDLISRRAYFNREHPETRNKDRDYMWYLWSGAYSPLFGKKKMATFERYFLNDKEVQREESNMYYKLRDDKDSCCRILKEFGLDPEVSHIVNGHVPVKVGKGESPVKAEGKLFVIDGGMSKPYQKVTGIAGYTLIYDSYSLILAEHTSFESKHKAIHDEVDIVSTRSMIEHATKRIRVGDTYIGANLRQQILDLNRLLDAYRKGVVKVKSVG